LSSQSLKYKQSSNLNSSLVVIGSSTGGTEALRVVLTQLPANIPPILIVQHIPPVFSLAFANRLNELCPFEVKEAEDDDIVEPNKVLIAPGGKQMSLVKVGGVLKVKINDDPPVNRHKPSVDYLFASVAKLKLSHIVGVILTGMGADGARELLSLKKIGARTIAQNQETCIVWGMPREAAKIGAAEFILALDAIPQKIMDLIP
jgi:two-component system chemotaxis response regulator CheB